MLRTVVTAIKCFGRKRDVLGSRPSDPYQN